MTFALTTLEPGSATGKEQALPELATPSAPRVRRPPDDAEHWPGTIQPGRPLVGTQGIGPERPAWPSTVNGEYSSRPPSSVLSGALTALQGVLRGSPDPDLWQECARTLRAAIKQESERSRRHAALALLLSDVLSFTQPSDLADPEAGRRALESGWRALSEPFVSGEAERRVTTALARAGWQLSLPYRGWAASN